MVKKGMSKKQIFSIVTLLFTVLANIAVVILVLWSYRYADLEKTIFFSIFGMMLCFLIVLDIIFFVGYNQKDRVLKYITCVLAVLLLVVGGLGSFYVGRVNKAVGNIIENTDGEQYETIRVVVATYDNNSIKELSDLNGKVVGSLNTTGISAASVGREQIEKAGVKVTYKDYNMSGDLYEALVEGDIDAAIFPNTYRSQLLSTDDAYSTYLDKTVDIFTHEEKVKTASSESSKKDLSVDPFTILLIGYAPEPGGGGLTDTIILASVNPSTMQVTMVSIPRDSYVPISCYGGARSKINDAGAASKACLMETVGDLLDVEVDFYMEVNFDGLVDIVDALGGIYIDSPVEFVGQSPSSNRGEYSVWVPAGPYIANGEQALAFARERHAMPGGDYDRQIHQQEVIKEIAKGMIELRDVNKALDIMEAAGENFSTNLSLKQLTSVFNYLINATNYTGISQFNMIDIRSSRITGYTYWFYNYSCHLPLWSLYLYNGSIRDNVALLDETLGEYDTIDQSSYFKFFAEYPYDRGPLYFEYYNEAQVPQDMPAYVHRFTDGSYSIADVQSWADASGVGLNIVYVQEGDPRYVEGAVGLIVDMSAPYGTLASDLGGSLTIWVCGDIPDEDKVPYFIGRPLAEAEEWANANGYTLNLKVIKEGEEGFDINKSGLITAQSIKAGANRKNYSSIDITYIEKVLKPLSSEIIAKLVPNVSTVSDINAWCNTYLTNPSGQCALVYVETNDQSLDGLLAAEPIYGNNDGSEGAYVTSWFKFSIYKYVEVTPPETTDPEPTTSPDPIPTTVPSPDPVPTSAPSPDPTPAADEGGEE